MKIKFEFEVDWCMFVIGVGMDYRKQMKEFRIGILLAFFALSIIFDWYKEKNYIVQEKKQ